MWSRKKVSGFVLCVSGPSGSGKTSLCDKLAREQDFARRSISVTTRPQRPGEQSGKDYIFVSRSDFDDLLKKNELLEYAEVFGNLYGTPRQPVDEAIAQGQMIVMDIDTVGAKNVKKALGDRCLRVFIMPPSLDELKRRLLGRKQNSESDLARRLEEAEREMAQAAEYEQVIENHSFDEAYSELLGASLAYYEKLKSS